MAGEKAQRSLWRTDERTSARSRPTKTMANTTTITTTTTVQGASLSPGVLSAYDILDVARIHVSRVISDPASGKRLSRALFRGVDPGERCGECESCRALGDDPCCCDHVRAQWLQQFLYGRPQDIANTLSEAVLNDLVRVQTHFATLARAREAEDDGVIEEPPSPGTPPSPSSAGKAYLSILVDSVSHCDRVLASLAPGVKRSHDPCYNWYSQ